VNTSQVTVEGRNIRGANGRLANGYGSFLLISSCTTDREGTRASSDSVPFIVANGEFRALLWMNNDGTTITKETAYTVRMVINDQEVRPFEVVVPSSYAGHTVDLVHLVNPPNGLPDEFGAAPAPSGAEDISSSYDVSLTIDAAKPAEQTFEDGVNCSPSRPAPNGLSMPFATAFNVASSNYEYIPSGTYPIRSFLTGPGGRFKGAGRDKTILQLAAGVPSALWLVHNVRRFELEHVTLDLNFTNTMDGGSGNGQQALSVIASEVIMELALRHVRVINGWHRGITIAGTASYPISCDLYDIEIENCGQANAFGGALHVANATNFTVAGVHAHNNKGAASGSAVTFVDATEFTVEDMVSARNTTEGCAFVTAVTGCRAFRVVGGDFSNNQGNWGLAVSWGCSDFSLLGGSSHSNAGGGLTIDTTNPSLPTAFNELGAVISVWRSNGNAGGHGIFLNMAKNVDIIGGTYSGNGQTGIGAVSQTCTFLGLEANNNTGYGLGLYAGSGVRSGENIIGAIVAAGNSSGTIYDETGAPNTYLPPGDVLPGRIPNFLHIKG